jgi:hypothetical protein
MIQEVSTRLGVTRPTTIESMAGDMESIQDRDALILLGAMNQSIRSAAAAFTWRDMLLYVEALATPIKDPDGNILFHRFNIDDACVGYDGMTTSYIYATSIPENAGELVYRASLRQMSFDKFLLVRGGYITGTESDSGDLYMDRRKINGYVLIGRQVETARPLYSGEDPKLDRTHKCFFTYKCSYPVVKPSGSMSNPLDRKMLFTDDDDISVIDDECVILGTLMCYKNYVGRDYQLEVKLFMDYIEHMKERNGGLTIIEENEYTSIIDKMHRYPPPSTLGQGGGLPNKQQQQHQPQQQGQNQPNRHNQQQQQGE